MIFDFGKVKADIDVEYTRKFYKEHEYINDCSCSGCRNYRKYIENCDVEIKEFFSTLGIDNMCCITRIIPIDVSKKSYEKDHCIFYMGFYHVKGILVEGKKVDWTETCVEITDKFKVGIREGRALLPDDFMKPTLQLEINAVIPWILGEDNEYVV